MLKKEINFFGCHGNSYDLAKLAIFWKFSLFLYDLKVHVKISYRPQRPHFRIARFTSYNFFYGCLDRWVEKVGQKNCFLTSTHDFLRSKCQRSTFSAGFLLFLSMVIKNEVVAHKTSNIFIYLMTYFSWKNMVLWYDLSRTKNGFFLK